VKYFAWNDATNVEAQKERGIGFEDVVFHIERGDLLDILGYSAGPRRDVQPVVTWIACQSEGAGMGRIRKLLPSAVTSWKTKGSG
jgi:hypothetical protein